MIMRLSRTVAYRPTVDAYVTVGIVSGVQTRKRPPAARTRRDPGA